MAITGRRIDTASQSTESSSPYTEQYHVLIGRALIEFREKDILAMRAARRQSFVGSGDSLPLVNTNHALDAIHLSFDEGVVLTLIGEFAEAHKIFSKVALRFAEAVNLAHGQSRPPISIVTFAAIAVAHIYGSGNFWQRLQLGRRFRELKQQLATLTPAMRTSVQHKFIFLLALEDAMHHRHLGRVVTRLEDALYHARVQGDIKDEACIAEYLGRYLLANHCPTMAASALIAARDAYERWGLKAKVIEMQSLLQVAPLFFSEVRR
jgi:hypothetical protein